MHPLAKAATHTGVMVALFPSPATAKLLAQPGGEPAEDLHVTLAYLGDASELENVDQLQQAVGGWAATVGPLAGEVSGVGTFTAGPEPVTYASIDLPGLPAARERLLDALRGAGCDPSTDHGFTPHITLAYDAQDVPVPNLPLVFDQATVAIAGERTSYPLSGVAKTAHLSNESWNGSASRFTDEEWKAACILDRGPSHRTVKQRYALPVREPNGALNRRALAAAAARIGQVQAHPEQINDARRELRRLYAQAGLSAPSSLEKADATWDVPIWKADGTGEGDDPLLVYGVVLQPGVRDSQGDVISAAEIEKAAHRFLIESRKHDLQHDEQPVDGIAPVESYVAPSDLVVAGRPVLKGSWVMGVAVYPEDVKKAVREGRYTGFSIGGSGVRTG